MLNKKVFVRFLRASFRSLISTGFSYKVPPGKVLHFLLALLLLNAELPFENFEYLVRRGDKERPSFDGYSSNTDLSG
jgi:hypothetical protein